MNAPAPAVYGPIIKALTVYQPWATLIAIRAKPWEFRKWAAPERLVGRQLAIHAGARPPKPQEAAQLLRALEGPDWRVTGMVRELAIPLLRQFLTDPLSLPIAAVVCVVTLGQPIRNAELSAAMGTEWVQDSDRTEHTNYGWPMLDVVPLQPVAPCRGAQGLWDWRDERSESWRRFSPQGATA